MPDRYPSMTALLADRTEGIDYDFEVVTRNSGTAILAPHGGTMEPETSSIAQAIAGNEFSLYCFNCLIPNAHRLLHVTSTKYDEPRCLKLIADCPRIISIHGLGLNGTPLGTSVLKRGDEGILVGGLDETLRRAITENLQATGFQAVAVGSGPFSAIDPKNICNRGRSSAGVQLEITRPLRDSLCAQPTRLVKFANAIQTAIRSVT